MNPANKMEPYYSDKFVTIYCGDARELLPEMPAVDCVITDPVWPNSSRFLAGSERPNELWSEACKLLKTNRLVVHLGCDSDPRFLRGVPSSLSFLRVCWLEYACPTRKGRILYTGDVAYVFGSPIKSAPGRRLMPGRYMATPTSDDIKRKLRTPHKEFGGESRNCDHPCPRRYQHAAWLVGRFADGSICDPFAGSGTTLLAAKRAGLQAVGIEIEERYCEIASKRLQQEVMNFEERV